MRKQVVTVVVAISALCTLAWDVEHDEIAQLTVGGAMPCYETAAIRIR